MVWREVRIQELIGTRAGDNLDTVLATNLDRILRDAGHALCQPGLGPHHAVHPDVLHTQIHTLLDDLIRHLWAGQDENRIRFLRDGLQIRVAGFALELADARVDGEDLVAVFFEFGVRQVAAGFAFIGNADHSDLLLG